MGTAAPDVSRSSQVSDTCRFKRCPLLVRARRCSCSCVVIDQRSVGEFIAGLFASRCFSWDGAAVLTDGSMSQRSSGGRACVRPSASALQDSDPSSDHTPPSTCQVRPRFDSFCYQPVRSATAFFFLVIQSVLRFTDFYCTTLNTARVLGF